MTDTLVETITAPLPKNYRRRWRCVLWRTVKSMTQMDTSMRCAGVAYFGFLSLFPAVATLVLLIGLFARPVFLANMVDRLEGLIPAVALQVLAGQLVVLLEQPRAGLGLGLLLSFGIAVWSGSRGVAALMFATSRARAEPEKRGLFATIAISIATTLLAGVAMIVVLALVAIVPAVLGALPWLGTNQMLLLLLRWPVLLILGVLLIAAFYRFAPDRRAKRGRWIWPGAVIATLLWLAVCALFSFYVRAHRQFRSQLRLAGHRHRAAAVDV
ncbi:YihY/virulence factor BrkB family protein [Devosia sp. A8/3-2]|nr:YihY/virulence factor BrkB family protein [Devosia sp. A8/3-2]